MSNSLGSNSGGGTGNGVAVGGAGCKTVWHTETFTATAGQTVFTLSVEPSGDVGFSRNGAALADGVSSVAGDVVTYDPAANDGNALLAGDVVTISFVWEDCTSGGAGGLPLGPDPLTPLADVAALGDDDRGASLGAVSIPLTRALTLAELSQANAGEVSLPLSMMGAVFTNRAVEPLAKGFMNIDGAQGFAFRHYIGTGDPNLAVVAALDNNGVALVISLDVDEVLTVPAPRYAGQTLALRISISNNLGKATVNFPAQTTLRGLIRKASGLIAGAAINDQNIQVRNGESIILIARDTVNGWDVFNQNFRMFSGTGYLETVTGAYTLWLTASAAGVATFPAGVSPAANTSYNIGRNPAGITKGLTSISGLAAGEEIQISNYVRA